MSAPQFLYTNYPDDVIRKVIFQTYDGNKYCKVTFLDSKNLPISKEWLGDNLMEIKLGYLFRTKMKRRIYHKTVCRWSGRKT